MSDFLDTLETNDNRNYNYSNAERFEREEYNIIKSMIPECSKVIDLGCGNGALLLQLKETHKCDVTGVEISESGVEICKKNNIKILLGNIDNKLPFADNEFEYSICNVTIQMVQYPEVLLSEMKRISKYQIISFPNFGYFLNRLEMLISGRMPSKMLFGYTWFNTGHIHQLSINDFKHLINQYNLNIIELKITKLPFIITFFAKIHKNLFTKIAIFKLEK